MDSYIGNSNCNDYRIGSNMVKALYKGDTPIWEKYFRVDLTGFYNVSSTTNQTKICSNSTSDVKKMSVNEGMPLPPATVFTFSNIGRNKVDWTLKYQSAIPNYMFTNCTELVDVIFPTGITAIGNYSFVRTSLTSITIPANVIALYEVFTGCTALTSINFETGRTNVLSFWETFKGCTNLSSVTATGFSSTGNKLRIMRETFSGCTNLKSVELAVYEIGSCAFENCTSLSSVTFTITPDLYWNNIFSGCTALTAVTLPNPEQAYDIGCLEGSSLQRVQFGSEVKERIASYDDFSFVSYLGDDRSFGVGCTALTRIDSLVTGDFRYYGHQTIPDDFFSEDLPENGVVYYYQKSVQEPEISSYNTASQFVTKLGKGWTLVDGGVYNTN